MTNDIEDSPPIPSVLYPITYNNGFQINWSQNTDDDFQSYKLYESLSEDMSNQTLVYETSERLDNNYVVTGISEDRYYQITTEDVWGLQSTSDIETLVSHVELWGEFYSIENTTELDLYNNQLTGEIPSEIGNMTNLIFLGLNNNEFTGSLPPGIGNLTNLNYLLLFDNQLTGEIPENICDLNINWNISGNFNISNNLLCPPYPSCVEDYVGYQDTSDCD
jgi:Leucine-rich repeat (LRR) protein